jgi:hypothetical protein
VLVRPNACSFLVAGDGISYTYFETRRLTLTPLPAGTGDAGDVAGTASIASTAGDLAVSISPCDSIRVTVHVTNVGDRAGDEVTQLYLSLSATRSPSPLLNLRAFERTRLEAGASAEITFVLEPSAWAVVDDGEGSTDTRHEEGSSPFTDTRHEEGSSPFRGWMLQPANVTLWVGGRQPRSEVPVGPGGQTSDVVQVAHFAVVGAERELDQRTLHC